MATSMHVSRLLIIGHIVPANSPVQISRCISLTSLNFAGAKWRADHGQAANPNQRGRLSAEYPDYTYCDGRPTPVPSALVRKKALQLQYASSVISSLKELDTIKTRHRKKMQDQADRNQAVIDSKLKTKGDDMS